MVIGSLIRKLFSGSAPIIILFVLLLTSLYLMSGATHNSALFGELYSLMLGVNILAIFLLLVLIGKSLWQLIQQYRRKDTGTRLTARLVVMFVILSVTPVSVVYYFSLDFIKRGIDSWFDVRVENALNDALELSQASLGVRMRELLRETQSLSRELANTPDNLSALKLNELHQETDASELTLFSRNGRIIASSNLESTQLLPARLDDTSLHMLRQGNDDIGLVPIRDSGLHFRAAVILPGPDAVTEPRILQALFPVNERINTLADSVQSAFSQYREVAYLRTPLKYSFILTLSLVLLLSILVAIWAAFYAARRMVQPIYDLVEGTREVAAGNYDKRLPLPGKDELGFLVRSFNEMTHKIAIAQQQAQQSQQQLETQHAYLEAVLANLSSGVLTLDNRHTLNTHNLAASQILNLDLSRYQGARLDTLADAEPATRQLVNAITQYLDAGEQEWQEQVTLFGPNGRKVLMCRGTPLPHSSDRESGSIIVFDDITALIQAQRNAAWGEVARRLAHEIKNPLTPIQLAAERLRHKYLKTMPQDDANVLDRSTHTIVQQVETLKEMVKAFSDYARMPELQLETLDLNTIIDEVLDLYRTSNNQIRFTLKLDPSMPQIEADAGRLRQVLHNLFKNALEAMDYARGSKLRVTTRCARQQNCRYVELKIEDSGPGIPEQLFDQLFDPYVTTKPRGSGLGLAIVKKIVEEHGGMLWAENSAAGGATVIIRLPVVSSGGEISDTMEPDSEQTINRDDDAAA
ncbi:ATP-binding protein [Thiohalophilus thiocyanatoxydans]|uniref:histidine kinase n=1 Tax=Thiohalophilus thiocyanatoxydans TaxID=381308 RepID=A0A4R8IW21_9GAMM|nr:ATP-binding protein [Thiohalophilus thiocyanatoxydans]TDY03700.1 nitrogen fixation/metabolism regulation signal transduction histidine kinase [Thiohalophilus thiocyanatoxydans]